MRLCPIQWHDGMMLQPHHFQQMDLRYEGLLHNILSHTHPYSYGVLHVEYDMVNLSDGLLRIFSLTALMPDHIWIDYRYTEENPLEINLKDYQDEDLSKAYVYLCVPITPEGGSPVIGDWPKYLSKEEVFVQDVNDTSHTITIPRLIPITRLVFSNDGPPPRYTSMPIAQVIFDNNSFKFTSYMPPSFDLTTNSVLYQRITHFIKMLREKANDLSQKWQDQHGTSLAFETSTLLIPILHTLPALEALVQNEILNPFVVYQALCDAVGKLAPIALGSVPKVLEPYRHTNLMKSFDDVLTVLEGLINKVQEKYQPIPFQQDQRVFSIKLTDFLLPIGTESIIVGVRAGSTMGERDVVAWMKECVICTEQAVESIKTTRILGAKREMVRPDELLDLLPPRGVILFHVEIDPHFIQSNQLLFMFNPSDTQDKRPSAIVLYVNTANA